MDNNKPAVTLPPTVADWLRKQSSIGAKCGNCGKPFTVARKPKSVAGFPNGGGQSVYILCRRCSRDFKRDGLSGIPNAVNDAKLATMLRFMPVGGAA